MALRCAILDDYQDVALEMADWNVLADKVDVVRFGDHAGTGDAVVERLRDFDIVLAMRERTLLDRRVLERLSNLKLLVTTGMKNASIDMEAAREFGITVTGTGGSTNAAAEMTWALLLAVMRNIPAETSNLEKGGTWQVGVGRELLGRRLGIAGLGRLGKLVAGYGKAFGMSVSAWSRSNTPEKSAELGLAYSPSLEELLLTSDVVSLHLPLTPQTRGLVGAHELSMMGPSAVLINTSRGPLVDEAALVQALRTGVISAAGIDVFDVEPLPALHPFRSLTNLVATPHLGYVTEETYRVFFKDTIEDIAGWMAGSPVRVLN